jgi:SPP1 family predicted phage head-tail adaptor
MDAGLLDRRLKILYRVDTQEGTYGTKTATWPELATVWAKIEEVMPPRGDRLDDNKLIVTVRQAKVRIRWRGDVSQDNRVEIDGNQMRIISGPAMAGRRQWLDFMVEQLSTEGQQP